MNEPAAVDVSMRYEACGMRMLPTALKIPIFVLLELLLSLLKWAPVPYWAPSASFFFAADDS